MRYATGIDRRDWALLRSCFTDDCVADYGDIGEVIGLFLHEEVPRGLTFAETIDLIHAQGGLVSMPHPFDHFHTTPAPALLRKHVDDFTVSRERNRLCCFNDSPDIFFSYLSGMRIHRNGPAAVEAFYMDSRQSNKYRFGGSPGSSLGIFNGCGPPKRRCCNRRKWKRWGS